MENDPNNQVDYSDDEHDYLAAFEDGGHALIDQDRAPAMFDENNQSQDAQKQTNQPLGIDQKMQAKPQLRPFRRKPIRRKLIRLKPIR